MKKTLLFALVLCFAFVACNKDNPDPNDSSSTASYIIDGLTDITIDETDTAYMTLAITRESTDQEKVSLEVTGLPENVTAIFSTPSGIPSFGTLLTIEAKDAPAGIYPVKLTGTTPSGAIKVYELTLIINEIPVNPSYACIDDLVGTYTGTTDCEHLEGTTYSIKIRRDTIENRIILRNFPYIGVEMSLAVNCSTKAIYSGNTNIGQQQNVFGAVKNGSFSDPDNIFLEFQYLSGKTCILRLIDKE